MFLLFRACAFLRILLPNAPVSIQTTRDAEHTPEEAHIMVSIIHTLFLFLPALVCGIAHELTLAEMHISETSTLTVVMTLLTAKT